MFRSFMGFWKYLNLKEAIKKALYKIMTLEDTEVEDDDHMLVNYRLKI